MNGNFSQEALEAYSSLASYHFSEVSDEQYDFTRCVRPDGTFYGTRGKCRKGSETGPAEKEGTGARGAREAAAAAKAGGAKGGSLLKARAEGKKAAVAAARAEGGKKMSAKNARTRLFKEELEKVRDKMKGATPEDMYKLMREAAKRADERVAAGEGAASPGKKKVM